ncbi:hypothetical protein [Sphingomonas jatrophae]|uniref:Uncharacterized protein n=1 Tax=Sphingomonas jatrophae TaxID=1166337 RepID=A0A1I6JFV5_9SPHN|nr:hypothetical protein [Sphingomonas jatrophae]SFR77855.1 hypothetical protein SAMN05192580_0221 [Sphingomonas jatrophae]
MTAIRRLAGWVLRRSILFVALVAALLIYRATRPSFESLAGLRESAAAMAAGGPALEGFARDIAARAEAESLAYHRLGREALDTRIAAAEQARAPLASACGADLPALLTRGAAGVIDNRRKCLTTAALTREIETLVALRTSLDARRPGEPLADALRRHAATMRVAAAIVRDAQARLATLNGDYVPNLLQRREIALQRARITGALAAHRAAARDARALIATQQGIAAARRRAAAISGEALARYRTLAKVRAKALSDNLLQRASAWAETNRLRSVAVQAAGAFLLIVATPYLIRLFCFFVVAPLAARRPAIRLMERGASITLPGPSAPSVGVRLATGEELMVRQDYLQTSSHAGTKRTRWLLDPRHPLTSLAAGLAFLTRIRGDGELTTVSAVRDPFAEVLLLDLPAGAALVLHPRALAAVAQPIDQPLRVETRWRLGSLHAWLTLQLRYVLFHGPVRLVVKGGRGVRVEQAEAGRVFGQEQLVGFSADLAYSVTRAETFWPYFLGREPLLKDRVAAGGGILVAEEAPLAGRRGGEVRHGIEGLIDAVLTMFGL